MPDKSRNSYRTYCKKSLNSKKVSSYSTLSYILTSGRKEDLHGRVLKKISATEYRPDFAEMPFPMNMLAVFQYLE